MSPNATAVEGPPVPYNDAQDHYRLYLPAGYGLGIYYTRVSGQEKSNLTVMELLHDGEWGTIWSQEDIPPGRWPDVNPTVPTLTATGEKRYFSASAGFSNPNGDGQEYPQRYGQYVVQLDAATDRVMNVMLWLSPHQEQGTELVNTVVKFLYDPPVPNALFRQG